MNKELLFHILFHILNAILILSIFLFLVTKTIEKENAFYKKVEEYCGGVDNIKEIFSEFDRHAVCLDGRKYPPCPNDPYKFQHTGFFGIKWCS
ncbi:MAG: hypothetical protein QXO40_05065 [Candidatus Aenigmatarchaeota archaeon]